MIEKAKPKGFSITDKVSFYAKGNKNPICFFV